jgi:L-fuconolactonase
MQRPNFLRGLEALAEFNLAYDLLLFPKHLPVAVKVVKQFPRQRFVLDHIAKPHVREGIVSPWDSDVRALARFDNVSCKVSGLVTESAWHTWQASDFEPYLKVVFDCFGGDRLMFGSDWPVCTLAGDYAAVVGLVRDYLRRRSSALEENVMDRNAATWYGLAR